MFRLRLAPALAGMLLLPSVHAGVITENFSHDPSQDGWRLFGDTTLFQWDSAHHNVAVTWDTTRANGFFYHPLGTVLSRSDDFKIEFDLTLADIASGTVSNKTTAMEIGIGLYSFADMTNAGFERGNFGNTPSLAEFDYFYSGYYIYNGMRIDVNPTSTPAFVSTNAYDIAPTFFPQDEPALPTNAVVHVTMTYTAANQTAATTVTTNGVSVFDVPDVVLTTDGFSDSDDYRVDTFSINNYGGQGDDYDSLLAHGAVGNVTVTYPDPVQNFTGALNGGSWQGQFVSRNHWQYTLERSMDLKKWSAVGAGVAGNGGAQTLQDPNPPAASAFYRVSAMPQ